MRNLNKEVPAVEELLAESVKKIDATDRHVALVDCLHTWDDGLDLDVIIGGVTERFKACGMAIKIKIARGGIRKVTMSIYNTEDRLLCFYNFTGLAGETSPVEDRTCVVDELAIRETILTFRERKTIGRWLCDNFYH